MQHLLNLLNLTKHYSQSLAQTKKKKKEREGVREKEGERSWKRKRREGGENKRKISS